MRLGHFHALAPVCPRCRLSGLGDFPVSLAAVDEEDAGGVRFGSLLCSNPACWLEFPIIDGAPVLVPDVRGWIAANAAFLTERDDLPPRAWSQIGDCCGPDSPLNASRQHRSNYAWDHWGAFDPEPASSVGGVMPGGVVRLLAAGLALLQDAGWQLPPEGHGLDVGTACGRAAFVMAEGNPDRLTLGIDLNWPLLRIARQALVRGAVSYPLRRVGMVFDERCFTVPTTAVAERVDFWVADAQALPFADRQFGFLNALNILDSIASPLALLDSLDRLCADGGRAVLATPFDWATGATPLEGWLGGHSQRGPDGGSSLSLLRRLLQPDTLPQSLRRLRSVGEGRDVPWAVRLHDRSAMHYVSHVIALAAG